MDEELAAQAEEQASANSTIRGFALDDKTLSAAGRRDLARFGAEHGLSEERMLELDRSGNEDCGAQCAVTPPPPADPAPASAERVAAQRSTRKKISCGCCGSADWKRRDDRRPARCIREHGGESRDRSGRSRGHGRSLPRRDRSKSRAAAWRNLLSLPPPKPSAAAPKNGPLHPHRSSDCSEISAERARFANFANALGAEMLLFPRAHFIMGSEAPDAAPNERPLTQVTLSRFYHVASPDHQRAI